MGHGWNVCRLMAPNVSGTGEPLRVASQRKKEHISGRWMPSDHVAACASGMLEGFTQRRRGHASPDRAQRVINIATASRLIDLCFSATRKAKAGLYPGGGGCRAKPGGIVSLTGQ